MAERGEGEGPFLVFTASGIVGTRGTTYGVGVAATGQVRVGVEDGEVEIAGSGTLDAPVVVGAGKAATLTFDGRVESPVTFEEDDWGEWRDEAEAEADPAELAEMHAAYVEDAYDEMDDAYAELDGVTAEATVYVDDAAGYEAAADTGAYEESAEDRAAAIEAAYLAALRLELLTYALASQGLCRPRALSAAPEGGGAGVRRSRPEDSRGGAVPERSTTRWSMTGCVPCAPTTTSTIRWGVGTRWW